MSEFFKLKTESFTLEVTLTSEEEIENILALGREIDLDAYFQLPYCMVYKVDAPSRVEVRWVPSAHIEDK